MCGLQQFFNSIFFLYFCQFLVYSLILPESDIRNHIDDDGFNYALKKIRFYTSHKSQGGNNLWNNKNYKKEETDISKHNIKSNFDFKEAFTTTYKNDGEEKDITNKSIMTKITDAKSDLEEDKSISTNLFQGRNFSEVEKAKTQNEKEAGPSKKREKRQVVVRRRRRRRRKRCSCNGKKTKVIRRRNRNRRGRRRRVTKCICKKKKKPENPEPPPTTTPPKEEGEEDEGEYFEYEWLDDLDGEDYADEEEAEKEKEEPAPSTPTIIVAPTQQPTVIVSPNHPLYNYGYGYGGPPPYIFAPGHYKRLQYGNWPYYGVPNGNIPVYTYPIIPPP